MTFLQPTYLWALFSLTVPLLIHLLNKGDVKTVKVGSVKFLKESDTKQSRKIRLHEVFLLFLRMLLLGLIILYLAEPRWKTKVQKAALTYLIEPSLASNEAFIAFADSLPQNDMRWFATGFPDLEAEVDRGTVPTYWQLAQRLPEILSDSIVVFTKGLIQGIKGRRPAVDPNVHWIIVENESDVVEPVGAKIIGDSIMLFKAKSSSQITDLQVKVLPKNDASVVSLTSDNLVWNASGKTSRTPILQNDTLHVTVAFDESYEREMRYVTSALKAISTYGMQKINIKTMDADTEFKEGKPLDVLVWLKDGNVPDISKITLAMVPDSLANSLIEPAESKNLFHLTERLNIENAITKNLTNSLVKLLLFNRTMEDNLIKKDQRVLPETEFIPNVATSKSKLKVSTLDISPWIWLAVFLVLVAERILSKTRKQ
ncbi:hypothetical protein FEK29_03960 [Maribacter aurantiacus]|uniref:Aerotolerance regulator N-terminal domain-containing protein n=1 Tax=Maribacter aurantiacus TaxID=1882343 RepID=A0A5R8MBK4_9FLAO|nr:hypothetical protein FEK29_03960 [Maribacter aurantiacus]